MAAISPKLKFGLGLAAAAAAFSLTRGSGTDEPLLGESFESPLAFVADDDVSSVTWDAPPVTRNPFASGQLNVDPDAAAAADAEADVEAEGAVSGGASDEATTTVSTSLSRPLDTTQTTLSLAETVDRRLPPAAGTIPSDDGQAPTTTGDSSLVGQ